MKTHPMPYRILWTWDSWICDPFDAESYVNEYKDLIDFMAERDYNGLIIWGFVDERHGGEDAARQVADYGREKGIRILPGVGAGGYEGYVISHGHRFNLTTFLKQHPHLGAQCREDPDNVSDICMCLYQQESLEWLRAGAKWLAENFDIGGVNIETNEMGRIDVCQHAREATDKEPNRLKYAASFCDLAATVPIIHEEIKKQHPDSWVIYATYEPSWWDRQEDAHLLADMPKDAIAQWNIEMNVNSGVKPPVKDNISLIHSGGWSYHLAAFPPTWTFTQYRCFYPILGQARQFAVNQHKSGADGFALGNVGSHKMPDNEIVYIAHLEFSRDPEMTMDQFSRRFIAPLYGERAEPLVKELMLRQTAVHECLIAVWKTWTWLMLGQKREKPAAADPSSISALENQLDLAHRALDVASDSGRQRLEIIIQILNEYLSIARMSVDPRLQDLARDGLDIDESRRAQELGKLAQIAAEHGLPDDIYHYSSLVG